MGAARCEVWWADLGAFDAAALWHRLDEAERARAERFRFDFLRRRYVVAHAMVRSVLGFDGAFETGPHGKPTLPGGGPPQFNLSHSGERAVVAVCPAAEVGVDVEEAGRQVGPGVAERIMSPHELAAWRGAVDRNRFLLETWVRKEAVVKATGEGITRELRTLSYHEHTVVPLDLGPDYIAALAVAAADVQIEQRQWAP